METEEHGKPQDARIDGGPRELRATRDLAYAEFASMAQGLEPLYVKFIDAFRAEGRKALAWLSSQKPEALKSRPTRRVIVGLRLRAAWRHPFNNFKRKLYRRRRGPQMTAGGPTGLTPELQSRIEVILNHFNHQDEIAIRELVAKNVLPPVHAIVFVDALSIAHLEETLRSLRAQEQPVVNIFLYCQQDIAVSRLLRTSCFQQKDVRVLHHGEAVTETLAPARGALLIAGSTTLRQGSVVIFSLEILRNMELVYSDEIFVDENGEKHPPFFKPCYSRRLAESSHYMGSCGLVAFSGTDASTEMTRILRGYDRHGSVPRLLTYLAANASPERVARTPFVLFEETDPSRRALPKPTPRPVSHSQPSVSILIPTRDRLGLLEPCIRSILERTLYPRDLYEIVVIDNSSEERETLAFLEQRAASGEIRVIRDDGDFNFARLNNRAANTSRADVLLFLNNDTIITQADWLQRLAACAMEEDVGVVGARLLFEDGEVQHGGVVLGILGVAGHADVMQPPGDMGYYGLSFHDREMSAVTGACMATRRSRFEAVGGFDEKLAVAFNDTLLCVKMLGQGLVNIQMNSVLVTHLESKSRGYDDTPERKARFWAECRYARENGQSFFLEDRYYNPNLSLHAFFKPAELSRRRKPWRGPMFRRRPSVLLLSCTHEIGHGVPVVIAQQAKYLAEEGFEVHVGGPLTPNDISYQSCVRVEISGPAEALSYARENDIDILLPHTPPFFTVSRYSGPYPIVAAYDHGEPPAKLFPDEKERMGVSEDKVFCLMLAHRLYSNSACVKEESGFESMVVAPLGNSHMSQWSNGSSLIRRRVRQSRGWDRKVVVLNVCRFHEMERRYKGVDFFLLAAGIVDFARNDEDPDIVFVQAGKANPSDIAYVESNGVTVVANVSDEEMIALYCAADIYANFSQWEGWNLGIAQALAFGLPVVASDIAAHRRNFSVDLAKTPAIAARTILDHARRIGDGRHLIEREPFIEEWRDRLRPVATDLMDLWRNVHTGRP